MAGRDRTRTERVHPDRAQLTARTEQVERVAVKLQGLKQAGSIVEGLSDASPLNSVRTCVLCRARQATQAAAHDPECPWRRAVEHLA